MRHREFDSHDMSHAADDYADIRESVRALCARFPGEYWRKVDRDRAYPTEFVAALTEAGYLAALIPEEFGGSGLTISAAAAILEEVHAAGCNGAACHAQMYTMGTILRHGSDAQKQAYLPKIASGELRLQAFGVTEPTSGTDTLSLRTTAKRDGNDHYVINGQKIWTSRAEHSDLMLLLARTTPKEEVKKRTDGLSVFLVDMRTARGQQPGDQADPHHDEPRHHRGVLRQSAGAGGEPDRRGGQGLPLHPLRHERRAHPDRRRMHRRRQVVHRARQRLCQGARAVRPADRPEPGRAVSDRAGLCADARRRTDGARGRPQIRGRRATSGRRPTWPSMLAADASWVAADMCVQTHGGFGFAEEYDVERKFREARLYQVAPISTNMILSYLAEHVLGLPRSY